MALTKRVRVGFIGAGSICKQRHLPGLAKLDGVDVVAVCNQSVKSSQAVADEFNIPEIEEQWQTLVARDDLDALFIGTWPYRHSEMAIATLEAGKHCFCQARMCMNLTEAKQMLHAAQAHKELVNMICPPPMRMPFEPWIKKILADGVLGELTLVELRSVSDFNLNPNAVHWRENHDFSGNHILAMGIYAETLNAIVGPYRSLSANLSTPLPIKTLSDGSQIKVQIPQVVTITGKLENGALAVEHHTGLACDQSTLGDTITLWGTKGTLRYKFLSNTIELGLAGKPLEEVAVASSLMRDWQVEKDFIQAVNAANNQQAWSVSPDFEEGFEYMAKVQAVHESASTGNAVKLASL